MIKRPMIATRLSEELVNLVDIVGYMTTANDNETGETKRLIIVDPASDKYVAKDRTGRLGRYIEPNFTKIVDGVRGDAEYSWIDPVPILATKEQIAAATKPAVPNSKVEMTNATLGESEEDRKAK